MKILFAITNGDRGGAQEHLRIIATGLVARGHEVVVLVRQPTDLATLFRDTGVKVVTWRHIVRRPHPVNDIRARLELKAVVKEHRPHVLHTHSAKAGILGRGVLAPPAGVTIFTCHHASFGPGRRWSHRALGRPLEQITLPLVHGIISVGARDMPMLKKLAPGVPVELVRNAVPPSVADPYRSRDRPPVALWVARMAHPKDPLQAIRTWQHVVDEVPDARLVMCGAGPLLDRVRQAAAKSPVNHAIDVRGRVDDLAPVLNEASIYLLCTQVEGGTTMATLEAMSAGLVPVISDAGDAFLYTHAGCGVVVARNAPRAVAAEVSNLFLDPERLEVMRSRAIDFARRSWTTDDMIDRTLEVYAEVRRRNGIL